MIDETGSSTSRRINRREFVLTGTAAGLLAGAQGQPSAEAQPGVQGKAPAVARGRVKPVVISSDNGHVY